MLTKRLIPCLDIDKGRVVKGVSFENIRDAGDPVELAVFYDKTFGQKIKKLKKIKTRKLSEIFHKNRIYKVDFLNIDAEGHELNILKSINLKKFDIKVICVEVLKHNLKAIIKSKKLIRHLNKNGFKFKFRVGINFIFIR